MAAVSSLPGLTGWQIDIRTQPSFSSGPPLYTITPTFHGAVCRIQAPGFRGAIDPRRKSAGLQVHPQITAADLLYFRRLILALDLFHAGNLMVHAAAILHHQRALLFAGHSGAGKSTLAQYAAGRTVLDDDLIAIYPRAGTLHIAALPAESNPTPALFPLGGIFLLAHDKTPHLAPVPRPIALAELVANSPVINAAPHLLPALFSFWRRVLSATSIQRLHFRPDTSFWELLDDNRSFRHPGPRTRGHRAGCG